MPKVTVLMPVFNGERYLRKAVESVLCQTFQDFQFLIINDGSTDNTRDLILSYDDARIMLVDNKHNVGQTKPQSRTGTGRRPIDSSPRCGQHFGAATIGQATGLSGQMPGNGVAGHVV